VVIPASNVIFLRALLPKKRYKALKPHTRRSAVETLPSQTTLTKNHDERISMLGSGFKLLRRGGGGGMKQSEVAHVPSCFPQSVQSLFRSQSRIGKGTIHASWADPGSLTYSGKSFKRGGKTKGRLSSPIPGWKSKAEGNSTGTERRIHKEGSDNNLRSCSPGSLP
jgi:hypothetical protein